MTPQRRRVLKNYFLRKIDGEQIIEMENWKWESEGRRMIISLMFVKLVEMSLKNYWWMEGERRGFNEKKNISISNFFYNLL